jgi:hypothetical protein
MQGLYMMCADWACVATHRIDILRKGTQPILLLGPTLSALQVQSWCIT